MDFFDNSDEKIILDERQKAQMEERSTTMKEEYQSYVKAHPEIKQILSDFLCDVLANRPEDVFQYGRDYFESLSEAYDKEQNS
ncbi:hypothetical protein BLNAU_2879 [Blattamonas nauphoetae]|uniref:RIIa domain-containing protein n=1 Tax=Blattamonas nauphoetae TaxID=2049346 RepID=A0ABQ9YEL7_9EUKA|nr:hypothetical protein BLNAU_2879 [Blattamonas nauphoetae]